MAQWNVCDKIQIYADVFTLCLSQTLVLLLTKERFFSRPFTHKATCRKIQVQILFVNWWGVLLFTPPPPYFQLSLTSQKMVMTCCKIIATVYKKLVYLQLKTPAFWKLWDKVSSLLFWRDFSLAGPTRFMLSLNAALHSIGWKNVHALSRMVMLEIVIYISSRKTGGTPSVKTCKKRRGLVNVLKTFIQCCKPVFTGAWLYALLSVYHLTRPVLLAQFQRWHNAPCECRALVKTIEGNGCI